jgi:hypothetical protein
LDEGGFVHGKKQRRASLPMREQYHDGDEEGATRPFCNNT